MHDPLREIEWENSVLQGFRVHASFSSYLYIPFEGKRKDTKSANKGEKQTAQTKRHFALVKRVIVAPHFIASLVTEVADERARKVTVNPAEMISIASEK